MKSKIAIYSQNVILSTQSGPYTVLIEQGKITAIKAGKIEVEGYSFYDYHESVIMPGIIDPHVHINEPGREEWEGFYTGTTAAAAGGVTTLVDMPLNSSPVTINVKELKNKLAATEHKIHVNCGFWGGIVPGNTIDLMPMAKAGVLGFKAFLTHSGIDEFPDSDEATMRAAYEALKGTDLPILAHCEITTGNYTTDLEADPTSYQAYLKSRPRKWENDAVDLMLRLAEEFNHPTHIVHLSSSDTIQKIQAAKERGVPVTVETCPHYIFFNAEEIPNKDTRYKCAPPIREKGNNELLWKALIDGTLNFIGSDHSPAPPGIKELDSGNLLKAWGGISGIQFTLPALWTKGQEFGLTVKRLNQILCEAPAKFIGLHKSKGKIEVGFDADFVVWDPNAAFLVTNDCIEAKHKVSPYQGLTLKGKVEYTWVAGDLVWNNSGLVNKRMGKVIIKLV